MGASLSSLNPLLKEIAERNVDQVAKTRNLPLKGLQKAAKRRIKKGK